MVVVSAAGGTPLGVCRATENSVEMDAVEDRGCIRLERAEGAGGGLAHFFKRDGVEAIAPVSCCLCAPHVGCGARSRCCDVVRWFAIL